MSGIAPNPLNAISKVYLEQVAEAKVEPPKGKLKTDRNMFNIPKDEQQAARERLLAKSAAKRKAAMEALDPVGQEDADIDNDGDTDKSDKYLHKRRKAISAAMKKRMKEERELAEIHKQAHMPHEVPDKDLKKLVAKAVKRIDTDVDGDTDHNDKAKGELGEFVPGVGNKRLYSSTRTKTVKESLSNWRQDLTEIMNDEIDSKKIKEKKVNNKIKINPEFKEALEEIGGTLIEMVEIGEEEYRDPISYALDTDKKLMKIHTKDDKKKKKEDEIEEGIGMTMAKAVGNPPALSKRMKLKQALLNREIKKNAAANKKKSYSGKAAVSEAVKGQDTESRKAAAAERKAGDKRLSPSAGKQNADKMERDIKFYDKVTKKTKPSVVGMTHEEVEQIDERSVRMSRMKDRYLGNPKETAKRRAANVRSIRKGREEIASTIARLSNSPGGVPASVARQAEKVGVRKDHFKGAARTALKKEEVEQLDEMPFQVMGSPDGGKEKKIGKPVKSKKYADARAAELADTHKKTGGKYRSQYVEGVEQVDEEKKKLPYLKMFRKAGNLGRDGSPEAMERSKKITKVMNDDAKRRADHRERDDAAKEAKKMSKEEVEIDEKLNMKKEKMGDVIKDFYKSDAPQFKGKSKEKRRQMAIAAKLTAERGGRKLGEGATEAPISPQELALQKRKTMIDQMIAKKRQQALQKQKQV